MERRKKRVDERKGDGKTEMREREREGRGEENTLRQN